MVYRKHEWFRSFYGVQRMTNGLRNIGTLWWLLAGSISKQTTAKMVVPVEEIRFKPDSHWR